MVAGVGGDLLTGSGDQHESVREREREPLQTMEGLEEYLTA